MEGCPSSFSTSRANTAVMLMLLVFSNHVKSCSAIETNPGKANIEFIIKSCEVTKYPRVCLDSLSVYASTIRSSQRKLARAALLVSLRGAQKTSAMLSQLLTESGMKPEEVRAMKDCMENISDSMDQLKQSIKEMTHLGGSNFRLQMNNIQTWVSAVLTDEDTCMDGLAEAVVDGSAKSAVANRVRTLAQLTSNALALINSLDSTS